MWVYQVMTTDPISVDAKEDLADANELMLANGLAQLPVLRDGHLVGIVTGAAVRQAMAHGEGKKCAPVTTAMRTDVETCHPGTSLEQAGITMDRKRVATIYVVTNDGRLVGEVDDLDLIDWYGDADDEAVDQDLLAMVPMLRQYGAERLSKH